MTATFDAITERVERAKEHIRSLEGAIRAAITEEAYRVEAQPRNESAEGELLFDLYAEQLAEPPTALGIVIGEVANSLRASLDNLVYALAVKYSDTPPPSPLDRAWKRVRWPITLNCDDWRDRHRANLHTVRDPDLVAKFKRLQPFERRQQQPELDEFTILDEIWNVDKHRQPNLVGVALEFSGSFAQSVLIDPANNPPGYIPPGWEDRSFEIVETFPDRKLEGRTQIGVVRMTDRSPLKHSGAIFSVMPPHMHVNPVRTVDIAFDEGAPAYGEHVIPLLNRIVGEVEAALQDFRAEFA